MENVEDRQPDRDILAGLVDRAGGRGQHGGKRPGGAGPSPRERARGGETHSAKDDPALYM